MYTHIYIDICMYVYVYVSIHICMYIYDIYRSNIYFRPGAASVLNRTPPGRCLSPSPNEHGSDLVFLAVPLRKIPSSRFYSTFCHLCHSAACHGRILLIVPG